MNKLAGLGDGELTLLELGANGTGPTMWAVLSQGLLQGPDGWVQHPMWRVERQSSTTNITCKCA